MDSTVNAVLQYGALGLLFLGIVVMGRVAMWFGKELIAPAFREFLASMTRLNAALEAQTKAISALEMKIVDECAETRAHTTQQMAETRHSIRGTVAAALFPDEKTPVGGIHRDKLTKGDRE